MAEVQLIQSDKYGTLRVVQGYHDGPRPIFLLENGAYVFDTGLPVTDKTQLRQSIPVTHLQKALDWFDHRRDEEENPPRAIKVLPNNRVVFEDTGEDVQNIQDIVAYFDPGPFREAAMIAFADKLKADRDAKNPMAVAPKKTPAQKKKAAPKKAAAPKPPAAEPPAMTQ